MYTPFTPGMKSSSGVFSCDMLSKIVDITVSKGTVSRVKT